MWKEDMTKEDHLDLDIKNQEEDPLAQDTTCQETDLTVQGKCELAEVLLLQAHTKQGRDIMDLDRTSITRNITKATRDTREKVTRNGTVTGARLSYLLYVWQLSSSSLPSLLCC